ncbi:MAG TPA: fatty acid desaturase [Kofleriaceae bacterium]|nr:fatty acid desaturase [Kofleriaceae bacterium]
MSRPRVFRFSSWDALSVAVIPFQIAFFVVLAYEYRRLSPLALVALFPALFALYLQNAGANHNHYHTPFFRARWLNILTSMGFSMTASPKTPYNVGHGMHHATAESWNDMSILGMMGLRRPPHKQVLAALSFVAESFGLRYLISIYLLERRPLEQVAKIAAPKQPEVALEVLKQLKEPETLRRTKLDLAAWLGFRIVLCAIDWKFFLLYFLPCTYVIDMIRQGENYFQHWGAVDPNDRKRDSVSCYGTLYNLLTFNLGYHQEHHLRPGVHWLKLPRTTVELPPDRRSVPVAHYVNLPIFYPRRAAELARRRAEAAGGDGDSGSPRPE